MRLKFAKFPIERAYLYHQIASTQLSLNSFEECCFKARQALKGKGMNCTIIICSN